MFNTITDWVVVAESGPTIDGREIKPEWLTDAAKHYDRAKGPARIWPNHYRWMNYGTVHEVKTEKRPDGGINLLARLEPNENYIYDNRNGQLLNFSVEITEDYFKKGHAYLTGLGITDEPASSGTTEMRFSALAEQAGKHLGLYVPGVLTFTQATPSASFFQRLFEQFAPQQPHTQDFDMNKEELAALLAENNKTLVAGLAEVFKTQTPDKNAEADTDKPMTKAELLQFAADVKAGKVNLDPDADKPLTKAEALNIFKDLLKPAETDKPEGNSAQGNDALVKLFKDKAAADDAWRKDFEAKFAAATGEQPGTDGGNDDNGGGDLTTDC